MEKLITKQFSLEPLKEEEEEFPLVEDELDETKVLQDIEFFCQSSCIGDIKNKLKLQRKVTKFTKKMTVILKAIKAESLEKKFRIVMQSAEDYLQTDNDLKQELCIKLLKHVLNDDAKLTLELVLMFAHTIKKTSFLRRNRKRLAKYACFFCKKVVIDQLDYIIQYNLYKYIIIPLIMLII